MTNRFDTLNNELATATWVAPTLNRTPVASARAWLAAVDTLTQCDASLERAMNLADITDTDIDALINFLESEA